MSSDEAGWYAVLPDGSTRGPLTRVALLALRHSGQVSDDTLVWSLAWSEWAPLRRLATGASPAVPPAVAATPASAATKVRQARTATALPADLKARVDALAWPPAPAPAATAQAPGSRPGGRAAVAPAPMARQAAAAAPMTVAKPAARVASENVWQALRGDSERALPLAAQIQAQSRLQGARVVMGIRRFLARSFDLALLGGIGYLLLQLGLSRAGLVQLPGAAGLWTTYGMGAVAAMGLVLLPLEMLWTATGAPTPGKLLFGLRIRRGRRARLGQLGIALRRPGLVLSQGQALLLPLLSLIAAAVALRALATRGNCAWDDRLGTEVEALALTASRWTHGLSLLVLAWVLTLADGWAMLLRALG